MKTFAFIVILINLGVFSIMAHSVLQWRSAKKKIDEFIKYYEAQIKK